MDVPILDGLQRPLDAVFLPAVDDAVRHDQAHSHCRRIQAFAIAASTAGAPIRNGHLTLVSRARRVRLDHYY